LLYFMSNQRIYRAQAGSERGLDLNFAFDWTPDNITRNFSQVTGGVRYHGLIPRRERDTVAVGVVYSRISGALNRSLSQEGLIPYGTEKAVELNYAMKVTRWFTFQPVFQYYFDTGANPVARNNTVAGFRTSFTL
jgi:porin